MILLTNGEEHHGIGDGGRLVMTMAAISPLWSLERARDLPLEEEQVVAAPAYRKT